MYASGLHSLAITSHGLTFLLALIGHAGNAPAAELANALKVSKMLQMDRLRSSIVVDVKPWEDETDMQKIEEAIRSVQREGFTWSAWAEVFNLLSSSASLILSLLLRDSIAFVGIIFKLGEMKGSF
ncbi:elongation factor 1-beta-like protein [Tanacetum coccineum]